MESFRSVERGSAIHLLGQRDSAWLVDEFLVVQNDIVPGSLQKVEDLVHPLLRPEHQLLVVDGQTLVRSQLFALGVHGLYGGVPSLEALSVRGEVEPSYGYLQRVMVVEGRDSGRLAPSNPLCRVLLEPETPKLTFLEMMEWTVARPSLIMKRNLAFGNSWDR